MEVFLFVEVFFGIFIFECGVFLFIVDIIELCMCVVWLGFLFVRELCDRFLLLFDLVKWGVFVVFWFIGWECIDKFCCENGGIIEELSFFFGVDFFVFEIRNGKCDFILFERMILSFVE